MIEKRLDTETLWKLSRNMRAKYSLFGDFNNRVSSIQLRVSLEIMKRMYKKTAL